jgi:hypothetical protein
MSYIETSPDWLVNLQDVGLIMPEAALISGTSAEFQAFAESTGAEWPPEDHYPGSQAVNGTKIICVRIRHRFTPEQIDAMIEQFQLPWQCAYLASSYPIVDMGFDVEGNALPPAFEILRPMVFEALIPYLVERKDADDNVIPYTLDDELTLFAGASNTIRSMCGL